MRIAEKIMNFKSAHYRKNKEIILAHSRRK